MPLANTLHDPEAPVRPVTSSALPSPPGLPPPHDPAPPASPRALPCKILAVSSSALPSPTQGSFRLKVNGAKGDKMGLCGIALVRTQMECGHVKRPDKQTLPCAPPDRDRLGISTQL